MKTMLMTFLLIGSIQVMNAQTNVAYADVTNVTKVKSHSSGINNTDNNYKPEAASLAEKVKKMQFQVDSYDIKNTTVYEPNLETTYSVKFAQGINQINAVYAKDGSLIKSEGIFENVPVPTAIGVDLAKKYPGWEFHKTWCYSSYEVNRKSKILYKIQLKKDNKTKIIKINPFDYSL